MIQFNLLPDVKLQFIKARQTKRLVMMTSFIIAGAAIAIMAVLFVGTNVLQRRHMDNLNTDIKKYSNDLENVKDLNKILTVQNQLSVIDGLHDGKPAAARLGKYLSQIVPNNITLTQLNVDFTTNTMTFDGSADSLGTVNKFIDTLKFTDYKVNGENQGRAFSSVVMANFDRSDQQNGSTAQPATFQVTLSFVPTIFDIKSDVELSVPDTTTTRSSTESPSSPFQQSTTTQGGTH